MELVCNENSFKYVSMDEKDYIRNMMTDFVNLVYRHKDFIDTIFRDENIYINKNAKGNNQYVFDDWLNDSKVNCEQKRLFYSIINQKFHWIDFRDFPGTMYFLFEGKQINAQCGVVARDKDLPLISLSTHPLWSASSITGYADIKVSLDNIAEDDHFLHQQKQQYQTILNHVTSGQDLWEQRNTLFPNLIFCKRVEHDLMNVPHRSHIYRIIERLKLLNEYYISNQIYDAKLLGYGARTESETVKTDPNLKKQRLFQKPDETYGYFYDHISFSGDFAGRIHFLPDDTQKIFYIGYIGKHLHTQKY